MRTAGIRVGLILLTGAATLACSWAKDTNAIAELSPWTRSFELRGGFGYKDNVLLSAVAPVESALWFSEAEFFLFRIPVDGTQVTFFVSGEDTRYFDSNAPEKEQVVVALASIKRDLGPKWNAGLALQYLYQDQVFDVSATESELTTVLVRANSFTLRPSIRHEFGGGRYLELEGGVTRQLFVEPLDDYWEGGPKLTLAHEYAPSSRISLHYELLYLAYDTRTELTLAGEEIPGTSLRFLKQNAEVAWEHAWDRKRHWRSTSRLGLSHNTDSGSGYFDYTRLRIGEHVRFVAPPWEVGLQIRLDQYAFPNQTIDSLGRRSKDLITLIFRSSLELSKSWRIHLQLDHEKSISNRPDEDYDASSARIGIDWTF